MSHGTLIWVMAHYYESWQTNMSHGTLLWVMAHKYESLHTKHMWVMSNDTRVVSHTCETCQSYTRVESPTCHLCMFDLATSRRPLFQKKKNSYKSALQSFCWAFVVAKWLLSDVVWHSVVQSWSTASFTDKSCFQVLQHSLQIFKYSNMVFASKSHDKACMECMRWLQLVASINL